MLCELYQKSMTRGDVTIEPSYMKLTPVQEVKNGIVTRSAEFQRYCFGDIYKEFSYLDFSIGNILATGSTNLLNPVSMANHDVVAVSQGIDSLNEKLNGHEESAS